MCKTCNGTGGIVADINWNALFVPCPDTNCDFDRQAARNESIARIDAYLASLKKCESA